MSSLLVFTPDASTKTRVAVVGTSDDFLLVRVRLDWKNKTELLFLNDLAVVRRVVNDGRLEPETGLVFDIGAAGSELVALVLAVLEEGLDLLILHLVLNGAKHDALFVGCADLQTGCSLGHCVNHRSVDLLVNVNSLGGNANLVARSASVSSIGTRPTYLTTVLEGSHNKLWSSSLNVNILSNNTGIVAAELQSNTLEGLTASSHDLLSSNGTASKTDLRNARVLGEHGTKLVIATKNLNDARREDGLSQLNCLQRRIGSEG